MSIGWRIAFFLMGLLSGALFFAMLFYRGDPIVVQGMSQVSVVWCFLIGMVFMLIQSILCFLEAFKGVPVSVSHTWE